MNPISGNNGSFAKFITKMTKSDALAPVVALEATVVTGRTYQAYKRGKWDEARERFIEEVMGSITWLCGVASMNALGDKIVAKILKSNGKNFDVGTDKVLRTPFENFMKKVAPKGFTPSQVAMLKGAKVLTSVIITNLFIGFVVPKLNQALTRKLRHERKEEQQKLAAQKNPSFKGGAINALNVFTSAIENTNTGKLLSSDAGIAGGRMYNARSKEERREIAIRDLGSIYFYMWASGHVGNLLNMVESGHARRLNPASANMLDAYLKQFLDANNGSMSVDEFKLRVLGKPNADVILPEGLKFEKAEQSAMSKLFKKQPLEVIRLSEAEKVITDQNIVSRLREMAKLQPERVGEAVLTKQQVIDSINVSEINNPEFIDKAFTEFTKGKNKDEFGFVSNKKLYNLKDDMNKYVEDLCKQAKDGKIDLALLDKAKRKNLIYSGMNFAAGFTVAASFLSTFIPKIQYYVTKRATGVDAFPGTYDYEHHKETPV